MIDTDGERDYAEERAARAEQEAERASEQAHAELVTETVRQLRALGTASYLDAEQTVARFAEEVRLRIAPNAHRYELLARQQHIALLAPTVAAAIEETGEYDLDKVARDVVGGYRTTHAGGRDTLALGLLHATERVLDTVAEVAHHAQQAATDREVKQHERDLADRDAL
jgi:hypothetical protein